MCGIAGYMLRRRGAKETAGRLLNAIRKLGHRGPDGCGLWDGDGSVGLAHARLAIVDLSGAGAQPMVSACGRAVVAYNGEIYNAAEIRADLTRKGYRFKSTSDTEVLLTAYLEYGEECVNSFIGMFAFAVYDTRTREMMLCRDRVGVKPLYYFADAYMFVFASELKAIVEMVKDGLSVSPRAVGEFLQYGYISAPRSIYAEVQKVEAGQRVRVTAEGKVITEKYWSFPAHYQCAKRRRPKSDLIDELDELIVSACRYRTVADVPVGVFLSGGIDSSLVAAVLAEVGRPKAFTVGFERADLDETCAAAQIARALDLPHITERIGLRDAMEIVEKWADVFDEPFGDAAGIPMLLLSRLARREVKVVLSADGGDELFCGYASYPRIARRMQIYSSLGRQGRRCLVGLAGLVRSWAEVARDVFTPAGGGRAGEQLGVFHDRVDRLLSFASSDSALEGAAAFRSIFLPREIAGLMKWHYRDPRRYAELESGSWIEQLAARDFLDYLPDDILVKCDRATMSFGLEGREPLLDHRLVEFAASLPVALRHDGKESKRLLREVLYRRLPRELVERPKHGFSVPLVEWVEELERRGAVEAHIEALREKMGGFESEKIRWLRGPMARTNYGAARLWLLYVLGQWALRWL
jgi:asparagine synthase (glutamine-hydrolysing)